MKQLYFTLISWFSITTLLAQASLNTTLVGSWDDATVDYNDCWGYVDPSGNEYALIGSLTHFYVVSLPTSGAPYTVGSVPGKPIGTSSSIWRDMKTYGSYMYGVADQGGTNEGLTVIDLSNLPASISLVSQTNTDFGRAHNIYIDVPNARLYVAGSSGGVNSANNGVIIYSLANPAAPTRIASVPLVGGYVHDVFVKDNILYGSSGGNGLYIYNVAGTSFPGTLQAIGFIDGYADDGYNHSGWLSSDGSRFAMADETHGKRLKYVDVSDLSEPEVTASNLFGDCLISGNSGCIPHNPFINGNLCFVAYYHDGLQVFNMTDPSNITRVAYYDSYPNNTNYSDYFGAWGTYPFLPSGRIIISDITYGMRLVALSGALPVELTNFRAKYTDGKVQINWETAAERDCKFFEIERSSDSRNWIRLGVVDGHGNTSDAHAYAFTDDNPFTGNQYYRLRQVDFDDRSEVSQAVHVLVEGKRAGFNVFPTLIIPDLDQVSVQMPASGADITLTVTDMQGKMVHNAQFTAQETEQRISLTVSHWPQGIYLITAVIDGQTFARKVMK
jgi:choice-of-anchor B domain-containing protein